MQVLHFLKVFSSKLIAPISFMGGVLTIFGFWGKKFLPQETMPEVLFTFFLIGCCIIGAIHIAHNCYRRIYSYRISGKYFHRVSHLMRNHLASVTSALAEDGTAPNTFLLNDFRTTIEKCLDETAALFTLICGHKCAACFKDFSEDNIVKTMCRDADSLSKRESIDGLDYKHNAMDSTAFRNIILGECSYYINNNIPKAWFEHKYENTTLKATKKDPGASTFFGFIHYFHDWPLPYKSTMVFPIQYYDNFAKKKSLVGFFCIDSNVTGAFDPVCQEDIGAAFADIFYLFIQNHKEKIEARMNPKAIEEGMEPQNNKVKTTLIEQTQHSKTSKKTKNGQNGGKSIIV